MSAPDPSSCSARRQFLKRGVALGALAAASTLAGSLPACALFAKKATPDVTLTPVDRQVRVPAALLPWNRGASATVVAVTGLDDKLLLFRSARGEVVALNMTCTHLGCDVRLDAARQLIVCPCHGSEYDLHGGNVKGPADLPLLRYAVTMSGDDAVVTI